jgi:hypothetical protein
LGKFYEGLGDELSLFVRHDAWLNAIPDRAKHDKPDAARASRIEKMRANWTQSGKHEDDFSPDMPPLDSAEYLIAYLFEIGPAAVAGMGIAPIAHVEMRAWSELTGIDLQPWEVRILRRLSRDYVVESQRATKSDCPAPWQKTRADLRVVATSLQHSLTELANL